MVNKGMIVARKAIESRYQGLCTILEKKKVKDETTKATTYGSFKQSALQVVI